MTSFESAFLVDEGRGPFIRYAPLVPVGFIIDQGIDGRVDNRNFRETFLTFGFPNDPANFRSVDVQSSGFVWHFVNFGSSERISTLICRH